MLLYHEAFLQSPLALAHDAPRSLLHFVRRASHLLLLFLIFIITATNICAQNEPALDEAEIVRVRTDLVTVPVQVTDRKGQRVFGLSPGDFAALDDGRTVKLEYFAAGTERVALSFALDASGSTREIIARQGEAALSLFQRFGTRSSVAVWHFGARPKLITDFTREADSVRPAFNLSSIRDERTAIFDAAAAAVRQFAASDWTERRILILISDGLDTASQKTAAEVIAAAQQRAVSIYVIHLPLFAPRAGRLAPRPAAKGFRALAEATGGRYFMVGDAKAALDPRNTHDLAPIFKAVEEDLQSQYVLGFYPKMVTRDNSFHRIAISLTPSRAPRLRVRQLREGYTLK